MKITYKNKKPDWVNFGDIEVGQTFFDRDGELCIKVQERYDWNCVNLSNNAIYGFSVKDEVTPVNVELIVDGEKP